MAWAFVGGVGGARIQGGVVGLPIVNVSAMSRLNEKLTLIKRMVILAETFTRKRRLMIVVSYASICKVMVTETSTVTIIFRTTKSTRPESFTTRLPEHC